MKQPAILFPTAGKSPKEMKKEAYKACVKLFQSLGIQEKVREFKAALDKLKCKSIQ